MEKIIFIFYESKSAYRASSYARLEYNPKIRIDPSEARKQDKWLWYSRRTFFRPENLRRIVDFQMCLFDGNYNSTDEKIKL